MEVKKIHSVLSFCDARGNMEEDSLEAVIPGRVNVKGIKLIVCELPYLMIINAEYRICRR